jgi:hypothetical protein
MVTCYLTVVDCGLLVKIPEFHFVVVKWKIMEKEMNFAEAQPKSLEDVRRWKMEDHEKSPRLKLGAGVKLRSRLRGDDSYLMMACGR